MILELHEARFIRKTRLDELPAMFNVLMGDMSLVGPRPEREYFVSYLSDQIPFYDARLFLRPGISGLAQVNYKYGASLEDARETLMYDLDYLFRCSLWLDIKILFKAIFRTLSAGY